MEAAVQELQNQVAAIRREHLEQERRDNSAKVDRKGVHNAMGVGRSGTLPGTVRIVRRERKEEEKEIRKVARQERATTAESRDI